MRISNQTLLQNARRYLRQNLTALDRAEREVATGRRIQTVSDDPISAAEIMRLENGVRAVDQYRRNGTAATARMSAEDAVLTTVRDLLATAKEAAMSGAVEDPDDPLRQAALYQIAQVRDQILSLANTKVGDEYIFAGARTTQPAFLPDGTYQGDGTVRLAEIDDQVTIETNHTGDLLFAPALQALADLENELRDGTPASIEGAIPGLDAAQSTALTAQADIGARLAWIEEVGTRLAGRSNDLLDRRADLRDVEPAEAVLKVLTAQSSLERAYEVIGRVLAIDIMDYIN